MSTIPKDITHCASKVLFFSFVVNRRGIKREHWDSHNYHLWHSKDTLTISTSSKTVSVTLHLFSVSTPEPSEPGNRVELEVDHWREKPRDKGVDICLVDVRDSKMTRDCNQNYCLSNFCVHRQTNLSSTTSQIKAGSFWFVPPPVSLPWFVHSTSPLPSTGQ